MKTARFVAALFVLALVIGLLPACDEEKAHGIDGYVALVPQVLGAGEREAVSLSLFSGERLAAGEATVALLKDGQTLLETSAHVPGKGTVEFEVPQLPDGEYELVLRGAGFQDEATVRVEASQLIFLETDRPIYKPGQTIQVRAITLDRELKPMQGSVTIEVLDAKGIKVFKKDLATDDYGTGTLEVPISQEPNLGVWKVAAIAGERRTEMDVRIEEYVLPKYEVKLELSKEWFLVDEPISGKVSAEYSYGKPVKGELEVKASRYVGQWEEFATFSSQFDTEGEFQLPAAGYVAGVPEARGMGNVTLEVTVREQATGYEQTTTRLLTVAASPFSIQIIPESSVFRPTLPFGLLFVTETPDNQPVDAEISVNISYTDEDFGPAGEEQEEIQSKNGLALLEITPPADAVAMMVYAQSEDAYAYISLGAAYSPSGNFIHVEQTSTGPLTVGDDIEFRVHSTQEAANFYYEVVSRGKVVFTSFSDSDRVSFQTTPLMAPSSKLLVYQILANSEVAADYIPFQVEGDYPHTVQVAFSEEEVEPGDSLQVQVQTEGQAKVGLVAVDRSVFILAENRLNLQQVFDELERLYMEPQAELHSVSPYEGFATWGAEETFENAGVVVLTNKKVPEGKEYEPPFFRGDFAGIAEEAFVPFAFATPTPPATGGAVPPDLAEVQRIRQYFPETWLWTDLITAADGKGTLDVEAPDSITTWMLRAVGLSKDKGLGIGETELVVLQPFFIQVDLPYSAIRGEEFPVKVALYNYQDEPQEFFVELEQADWFQALDTATKSVTVHANDIGGVQFMIRPTDLGIQDVKVTARSRQTADAVIKNLSIVPEGVERQVVQNFVLSGDASQTVDTSLPPDIVEGSARAYVALTSSYLTQTIEGLDALLQMPFGCGEQNMILFAPDAYIARYLKETGQLRPEIMAKAEKLMITGYQREMTYRRSDGSFSAFGEQDEVGSLWLTAFVLRTFAQASDLIYIDPSVLDQASQWIAGQQRPDGSFEAVGFVHHQEMMGGVQGKTALTAYVATALLEAGDQASSAKAIQYLEGQLDEIDDAYTMAIVAYALELADSASAVQAYDKLMSMAEEDEDGLHWGGTVVPLLEEGPQPMPGLLPQPGPASTAIEATGYAALALLHHDDRPNASRAAKWLVGQRNAYGGFGSTQDTVVALQALTEYAVGASSDVDLDVTVRSGGQAQNLHIDAKNFDVLQVLEVPAGGQVQIEAAGRGQVVVQVVTRFNLPEPETEEDIFEISVDYGTEQVEVNDLITVAVDVKFVPPLPLEAGMVVLDVSLPTGFAPVSESIDAVVQQEAKIKRYEVAGRKVIFYIENMQPNESISFQFEAKALYPVKAKGVASQAYSYYKPEWQGETLGQDISVSGS
ncbi:MAG: alpha-2-macroglobulin family protein [Dehalococcoidia bacterium]